MTAHLTAVAPRWLGLRLRVHRAATVKTVPTMVWQCSNCRFGTTKDSLAVQHASDNGHQLYAHEVPAYEDVPLMVTRMAPKGRPQIVIDSRLGRVVVCHPNDETVVTRLLRFVRGIGQGWLN